MNEEHINEQGENNVENEEPRIGVFVCHCGTNIAQTVDVAKVVAFAATLPGVIIAREHKYMCSDPGQLGIQKDIEEFKLNRVVVSSCSPLMHELTFRETVEDAEAEPRGCEFVLALDARIDVQGDGRGRWA